MSDNRGLIANPNFTGSRVRGVYFFAGNWRFAPPGGTVQTFYDHVPVGENASKYTLFPRDPRHLGWSESKINRIFALDSIVQSGANTVVMSHWGKPDEDRWRYWAPMQTATGAHDELFDAIEDRPLLIMPAIESSDNTYNQQFPGTSNSYHFSQDFPGTPEAPATALWEQVFDLVSRYLFNIHHPEYASRWLQLFDRDGVPRYAINLLHVASAQLPEDADSTFAAGFDWVADLVFARTGVRVGFTLDVLIDGQELEAPVADRGGWQPWFDIHAENPGAPGNPVTALWANDEHLDLFAVSAEGFAMSIWWDQNESPNYRQDGWFAIDPATTFSQGTPIAAAWANDDHLDLFAVTSAGAVASIWWDRDSGYRADGWFVIHPDAVFAPATEVTALWANEDHLDLFAVDSSGVARTIWWDRDGGYRADGWLSIHPETRTRPGGHLKALWAHPDHLDLFFVTEDRAVSSIWWDRNEPGGYRADGWFAIGSEREFRPGGKVAALWAPANDVKHLDLFAVDSVGFVRGTWWDESQPGGYRPEGWFLIARQDFAIDVVTATWLSRSELLLVANGVTERGWRVFGANWVLESGWRGWFPIRKEFSAGILSPVTALVSPDPNHLDLFCVKYNGIIDSTYHRMNTEDTYVAQAGAAGGWLEKTAAVLAIQGFIPEHVSNEGNHARFKIKHDYWLAWLTTGIPVFCDVSPGYDAHLIFTKSNPYGNTPHWRERQLQSWSDRFSGMVYNTWNGYTEGFVGMPSVEHEDEDWNWIQQLFAQVQ